MVLKEKSKVEQLRHRLLPFPFLDPPNTQCHIKPMASGSAVRRDNPFKEIQIPVREAFAIDIEGSAFCQVMAQFPAIPWIVVKGISDYADDEEDNSYRRYAALTSASYLLAFLQEYLTEERMPIHREHLSQSQEGTSLFQNIPYPRNPFFTGREEELSEISEAFKMGKAGTPTSLPRPIYMLSGLGGVGKTQVAVEYAYRHLEAYQALLWVDASNDHTLLSSYIELAQVLNLSEREAENQGEAVEAVKCWLNAHIHWLLILDNVEDLSRLTTYLPKNTRGNILVTTRSQATGGRGHRIGVNCLAIETGALLLLRRSGLIGPDASLKDTVEADRDVACRLSSMLGGLPLALDQAGAYIEETQCGLEDYVSDDAIAVLGSYSLIQRNPRKRTLAVHRLVQLVLQDNMNAKERKHWFTAAVFALKSVFPEPDYEQWDLCGHLLPHVNLYITRFVRQGPMLFILFRRFTPALAELFFATAKYFHVRARYDLAERLYDIVQQIWEEQLGPEHTNVASVLERRGSLYQEQGKYTQAEPLYQQALHIIEQAFGVEHLYMSTPLKGLAGLYRQQGRYPEAELLYRRALSIREQTLGLEHAGVTSLLTNLASLYIEQGKFDEARPLYERAQHILERTAGPEQSNAAPTLINRAYIAAWQGRYSEAEQLYQQILALREQTFGPEHPSLTTILINLASLSSRQRRYSEAGPLYQRALHLREQVSGSEHREVVTILMGLASLHYIQGQCSEAQHLYERAFHNKTRQGYGGKGALPADKRYLETVSFFCTRGSMRDSMHAFIPLGKWWSAATGLRLAITDGGRSPRWFDEKQDRA